MKQPVNRTLTLRSPDDVLAAAPVVLGFVPTESAVMFTFDAASCFHARVDLPTIDEEVEPFVDALLAPCVRHEVGRVMFVLYCDDAVRADRVVRPLVRGFRGAGIGVIDAVRADGRRWFPLLRSRCSVPPSGVPYDVSAHLFSAESVLTGRVTHASRADLEATVAPDPGSVARIAAVASAPLGSEPGWVPTTVARHVTAGSVPEDEEAARVLVELLDVQVRDDALALVRRDTAEAHAQFWSDLVRRAPDDLVAPAAAVLALAAWLSGNGALAWCALDRCLAVDPDHRLAHQIAQALSQAVPPSMWEEVTAMSDPF